MDAANIPMPQDARLHHLLDEETSTYGPGHQTTSAADHICMVQVQPNQARTNISTKDTSKARHFKEPHLSNLLLHNPPANVVSPKSCPLERSKSVAHGVVPMKKSAAPKQHIARSKNHIRDIRKPNPSKIRRRVPQEMQAQWRVGAAPSAVLALSREESQVAKILAQATAFHISMFEVFWGSRVQDNQFIYDLDNRVELFRDSTVTAAALVATGKTNLAQKILERVLPSMDDLLRNPHPSLYLILAESALGLVKTPSDALQLQVVRYISGRALSLLGRDHPITTLLTLHMSQARKEALGDRLWRAVLPILSRTFGPDHYQSSTQVFCQARNMASNDRTAEEAIHSIEQLINRWSDVYGPNSLIVCYTKIELANILVTHGSNMKAEFVISDALRTSDIIQAAELLNEDCPASEKRHRESSIAFPKVAAFRTLGRLYSARGNLGAATHYYSQAVLIGTHSLGKNCATVELAQDELNRNRDLETKWSLEQFSIADVVSSTSNIIASPVC